MKRLIIAASIIATLLAPASASAQPPPVPAARVCLNWQTGCVSYRYVFGIRYCSVLWKACIKWL